MEGLCLPWFPYSAVLILCIVPTELDSYFDNIPLFVPGSHTGLRDASDREKELREGKVHIGSGAIEEIMEKEEVEKGRG